MENQQCIRMLLALSVKTHAIGVWQERRNCRRVSDPQRMCFSYTKDTRKNTSETGLMPSERGEYLQSEPAADCDTAATWSEYGSASKTLTFNFALHCTVGRGSTSESRFVRSSFRLYMGPLHPSGQSSASLFYGRSLSSP